MTKERIDLIELIAEIYRQRLLVVTITVAIVGLFIIGSFLIEERYRADVVVALVSGEERRSVSSGSLGVFGSLLLSEGMSNRREHRILATGQSRQFIVSFLKDDKIAPILFEERWDATDRVWKPAIPSLICRILGCGPEPGDTQEPTDELLYKRFLKILAVERNRESGIVTISVEWKDPELAAAWANAYVAKLDSLLREQSRQDSAARLDFYQDRMQSTTNRDLQDTITNLISEELKALSLIDSRREFSLDVIDPARPPMTRVHPRRTVLAILGLFVGVFLGVLIAASRKIIKLRWPEWRERWAASPGA